MCQISVGSLSSGRIGRTDEGSGVPANVPLHLSGLRNREDEDNNVESRLETQINNWIKT